MITQMPTCKKCGCPNKEGNRYCINCSHPLEEASEATKREAKISSNTIVAGFLLLVISIAAIWGYSWWITSPASHTATFYIEIESNTSWMGSIGGDGSSRSIDGSGSDTWKMTGYTIVSAVIQKETDYGYLTVRILEDGKVVDSQTTTAPYGVVSASASTW